MHSANRPKMFFIQKIEDFYFFANGYVAGREEHTYYQFFNWFSKHLSQKYNLREDISYHLAIRSMSIYDEMTLNILKKELVDFLNSDVVNEIICDKVFTRKELDNLLSQYKEL